MNNEIGRKLTSLTLMTIMLAGGMVIAAPSMVPEAAAAGQLYVSAENATFGNTFGGGQIVEIIVQDPNQSDTDVEESEPTVELNGDTVRMTQGADGYWYAYVADTAGVVALDGTGNQYGYDFGTALTAKGDALGETATATSVLSGAAVASWTIVNGGSGYTSAPTVTITDTCSGTPTGTAVLTDGTVSSITVTNAGGDSCETVTAVIADPTGADITLSSAATTYVAADVLGGEPSLSPDADNSHGLTTATWPFVQTYDLTAGTTEIVLEQAGSDEVVVLDYDSLEDFSGIEIDRTAAPQGAEVHLTIIDGQLNIDPTAEETVTFNYATGAVMRGIVAVDTLDISDVNGCDDNCSLLINVNANSAATAVLETEATADDTTENLWMTFLESSSNSGVWGNTDDNDDASLNIVATAVRGTTATIDYNDSAQSLLVAHDFASIDLDESSVGDEWNSGESMTIVLNDQDLNLNTASDESLSVSDGTLVPSIQIGSPLSLDTTDSGVSAVTSFSKIATYTSASATVHTIDTGFLVSDIEDIETDFTYFSYDLRSIEGAQTVALVELEDEAGVVIVDSVANSNQGIIIIDNLTAADGTDNVQVIITLSGAQAIASAPITADIFSFDGETNNAIYRIELEETDDNTGSFEGSVEYVMLNQLNVDQATTYAAITPTSDAIDIIVHLDMTDEDSPRINYLDLGADGVSTQIADQQAAPTHSGSADLDMDSYKIADTVVVTIEDQDLNTDSELIDVYLTQTDDKVGDGSGDHIADITFDDSLWTGLFETGFNLVETSVDSGVFTGSFQVPDDVTGTDIEVNYNDFRDGSGNTIEVGDGASIRANTGSVSFDRTVYPVPFAAGDFDDGAGVSIGAGPVQVHIRITDADYDISAIGEDVISSSVLDVTISRGSLATADLMPGTAVNILEVSPDSGVFEFDLEIASAQTWAVGSTAAFVVNQGDIITVEYSDPQDASGNAQTVTDSSSFDLRNAVLQSDKSVYLIGSDMILTLIEPDFDLDNDETESYTLGLVEWDSDAATVYLDDELEFDPEPSVFRETGDSTGIFQVVIEIPDAINSENLDRGEEIELEYVDYGPAGADYVGQESEDIGLTVYTSNFGATIELDQKVYTWTDKVYITIVAPDHNMDSGLVDEIGAAGDPVKVSTRGNSLTNYKLVESGADTGIFIGEVTLAGFAHDADGDGTEDITAIAGGSSGTGPTEGKLATSDNDGLTVSFEFSEDDTVVGSALIRWNIGEVQWLEASYPASGTGVVRVIDADMNLNPEAVDNFSVDIWSDSDAGGIDLTITETNEATGIFEGTVFFTVSNDSSGHRLRVAEGDTVTAEYEDNTLPEPYTTADELDITATTLIGTIVPPLERAPAANLRIVDAFGNSLNSVSVDQQVQLAADLANGQDKEQSFAYLVQIQDGDGVTVSLAWITGSLSSGQSFSPALSWIPTEAGSYTATAFVWESVDNPTALSPSVSTAITVQ